MKGKGQESVVGLEEFAGVSRIFKEIDCSRLTVFDLEMESHAGFTGLLRSHTP